MKPTVFKGGAKNAVVVICMSDSQVCGKTPWFLTIIPQLKNMPHFRRENPDPLLKGEGNFYGVTKRYDR